MKRIKNIKIQTIILFVITFIILYIVLKDNFYDAVEIIVKMNVLWFIISIIAIVLSWFFKALSMYYIAKEHHKELKIRVLFKQTVITQFFNGVTPFSSGGQPMEIYMLSKYNISVPKATNIVLQNSMVYQIALVGYGFIALLMNLKLNLFSSVHFLKYLVVLGFIVNTLVCIAIIVISFSKKTSGFILSIVTKLGLKLKVIKNEKEFVEKYKEKILEFHQSAKIYKNNRKVFFLGIFFNFIALTLIYIVPFFLAFGIGKIDLSSINSIISSAYTLLVGSFVPIPGGSGGIEYSFTQFFGVFTNTVNLSVLLIVWRFVTYYFGMILGAILFIFYKGRD